MLALTHLMDTQPRTEWPYKHHALLIATTWYELLNALSNAGVQISLDHKHLVPHAHLEESGYRKLRTIGVPLLDPRSNDRMHAASQVDYPLA